jgi:predicted PurR-regulated permease PerM
MSVERPLSFARVEPRSPKAVRILVALAFGLLLYFAREALIPIALSLLVSLVLSSPVEALHRKGVPRSASALLIVVSFLILAGVSITSLLEPAQRWLAQAPHTVRLIEQKIDPAASFVHRIELVTRRAGHLTDGDAAAAPRSTTEPAKATGVLVATRTVMVSFVTVLVLTLLLLASGPPVLARMTAALAHNVHATNVLKVIDAVRRELGRYYATVALINLGLGLATGLIMTALGMPNPVLWGMLAGSLNFIPYIGSAITLFVLTVVAFLSFDSVGQVLTVSACYLGLATIEGQVVQPLFVGQRLELNPIIVFLALWFGAWLWGVAGVVMAVPTLVTLKVVAEHSQRGRTLTEFLSPTRTRQYSRATQRPAKA